MQADPLDRFYTKSHVAAECCKLVDERYSISSFDMVIEPSAGGGAFVDELLKYDVPVLAMDVDPDSKYPKRDFLKFDLETSGLSHYSSRVLTIGNPPFGKEFETIEAFLTKAAGFSTVIAFILPRGYVETMPDRLDFLDLKAEKNLPFDSFTLFGKDMSIATCFYVFEIN